MTRRVLALLFFLFSFSMFVHAQDETTSPTLSLEKKLVTFDKKLVTLTSLTYASAIYDAHTTVSALERCHTCYEGNLLMRPFANSRPSAYAFTLGMTSVAAYGGYKLKQKGVRWWWVPMTATMALRLVSGVHNQHMK